jgi:hypothetical protein
MKLDKKFGFVELEGGVGDAFLHVSVLKPQDTSVYQPVPPSEYGLKLNLTDGE